MTATVSGAPSSALWMMPAFSPAIPAMSSPRYSTWSRLIGVITATGASITLVASQRPPKPTSMTPTSIGASANAANAIAVRTSNLLLLVDHLHERLEFGVGLHVCRWADRFSVDRDTLDRRLQVRAGGAPGAPLQSGQQRIDHPLHRGFAVGSGDVDRRVAALR